MGAIETPIQPLIATSMSTLEAWNTLSCYVWQTNTGGGGRSMEVFVRKDCFMKLNMARDEDFGGGRIKPEVGTLSLGVT